MVVQAKGQSSVEDTEKNENSSENSKSESAASVLSALRKRQKNSLTNGFDSLEVLRSNLQTYFNSQINILLQNFIESYFEPAIKNIKDNTDESIADSQLQEIRKRLLENCAKSVRSQYTSSSNDSSRNTTENEASDSDTSSEIGQSLLHQALKRKRTDSENENLLKRQFFITTKPNYFNQVPAAVPPRPFFNKPSLLTSALTSPPKAMSSRPVFHLITNRNSQLNSELVSLLRNNNVTPTTTSSATSTQIKVEGTEGTTDIKIKSEIVDDC